MANEKPSRYLNTQEHKKFFLDCVRIQFSSSGLVGLAVFSWVKIYFTQQDAFGLFVCAIGFLLSAYILIHESIAHFSFSYSCWYDDCCSDICKTRAERFLYLFKNLGILIESFKVWICILFASLSSIFIGIVAGNELIQKILVNAPH